MANESENKEGQPPKKVSEKPVKAVPKKKPAKEATSVPKKQAAPKKALAAKAKPKAVAEKPGPVDKKKADKPAAKALKDSGYAIIATGAKQYRVIEGDVIDVELLDQEAGAAIDFTDVLLLHDGKSAKVGTPHVAGAKVEGEVLASVRGPKVVNYKYKRRKNYHRKVGHRQHYTRVKIKSVVGG